MVNLYFLLQRSLSLFLVGHECDLAMLQIDDPSFWEGLEPLTFGPIPDLLEDVSVIGYPVGHLIIIFIRSYFVFYVHCLLR